jgi:hypothetical protein
MKNLHKLLKGEHILGLTNVHFKKDRICSACQAGKQVGVHHPHKNIMTTDRPLELLHMDLFGPIAYISIGRSKYCRRFDPGGVPGPTSKLSPRAPAQMGRRETEREGGKSRRETGVKGETRGLCVCPAPRSGALAEGGYKRPRGREREAYASAVPSFPARPTLCKRALDLPFIGVRRGSRCKIGRCSSVLTCLAERS